MKQSKFLSYFTSKHKLSMRQVRSSEEVWHIFITRGNLILVSLAAVLILFIGVLTLVAYSSIIDMVPGYPGNRSRELLVTSVVKLDSLEREIGLWERYTRDLQLVLDGRAMENSSVTTDSLKATIKGSIFQRSLQDSLLRVSMMANSGTKETANSVVQEFNFEMIAPISGIVVDKFAPQNNNFGVVINPKPNAVVLSVLDGTVAVNIWTPTDGYIVGIQHSASMFTFYKGLQQTLKQVGSRVRAGEGIGMSEIVTEDLIPTLKFELWNAGNAVDPQNFITFN